MVVKYNCSVMNHTLDEDSSVQLNFRLFVVSVHYFNGKLVDEMIDGTKSMVCECDYSIFFSVSQIYDQNPILNKRFKMSYLSRATAKNWNGTEHNVHLMIQRC